MVFVNSSHDKASSVELSMAEVTVTAFISMCNAANGNSRHWDLNPECISQSRSCLCECRSRVPRSCRKCKRKRDEQENIVKWYGVVTDIEDRKRAEDKVLEQDSELRQIVDLVPQLVAALGSGGERLYANRIGLDYAGLSLEEWRQIPGTFFSSRCRCPEH